MTYVSQLPQAVQEAIRINLTDIGTLEGYTGAELEQMVQDGMDSRVSDLELREVEKCTICNKPTDEGFFLNGELHCTEECRRQTMTDVEYFAAYEEDNTSFYWTAWYGEEL